MGACSRGASVRRSQRQVCRAGWGQGEGRACRGPGRMVGRGFARVRGCSFPTAGRSPCTPAASRPLVPAFPSIVVFCRP